MQGTVASPASYRVCRPPGLEGEPRGSGPDSPSRRQAADCAACRSSWTRLLAKVYEINPLVCPRCGSEIKIIALITDPAQVRKILRHLLKIGRAPPGLEAASLN